MPINMKKYVDIKSGINNIRTATEKDLIARIFTNALNNDNEVLEYTKDEIDQIREKFGNDSVEVEIAKRYFSFINKYSRSPKKISFYWDWRNGARPTLFGEQADLDALKLITAGEIKVTIKEISEDITGIDLSSVTSLNDVASILQTAIRGANEDETFAQADVFATPDGKIGIAGGITANYNLSVEELNDSPLCDKLGFANETFLEEGHETGTIEDVFDKSYQVSNNFATFVFINNLQDDGIVATSTEEAKAMGENLMKYPSEFMYIVPVLDNNKVDIANNVSNLSGVSLELCDYSENGRYNFILPMSITATTDYNKENGTVNYMFTQDNNMGVVVDDDDNAKDNDELKINYYGRTQQAGQKLAFYQNGVLQGDYQDQNIYVNEIWLKDALCTKFINYMLLTPNWYANKGGQAIGQGLAMDVIERAKLNGTITTEKEISEEDKVYIYNITSDENAWRQIYEQGYYLITNIEKVEINNQQTYQFTYTLLYSKGDSIKKVEGQNILI